MEWEGILGIGGFGFKLAFGEWSHRDGEEVEEAIISTRRNSPFPGTEAPAGTNTIITFLLTAPYLCHRPGPIFRGGQHQNLGGQDDADHNVRGSL